MPYINVNDVYIMDNTGKQVDDAVDYALANSNRNLLDNPWFTNPVNQRNTANGTVTSTGYFIDRWVTNSANTVALNSASITIMAGGGVRQYLEAKRLVAGTYTVSVLTTTGTVHKVTGTLNPSGTVGSWQISGNLTSNLWCGVRLIDANRWDVAFTGSNASSYITAVKLELGSYSTLANDVPPDYGEELRKCQRYFLRLAYTDTGKQIGFGYMYSASQARILIPTPVTMRANSNVSVTNIGNLRVNCAGTYLTPSSASSTATVLPNGVNLHFNVSSGTSGALANVFSYGAAIIDLSADL